MTISPQKVRARAQKYAMDIAKRRFDTTDQKYLKSQAKVTPSLLALARVNLNKEAARTSFNTAREAVKQGLREAGIPVSHVTRSDIDAAARKLQEAAQ